MQQSRQTEELLRQLMSGGSPLHAMLRNLGMVAAEAPNSVSEAQCPSCPGLNIRNIGDHWIVPSGSTSSEVTYCTQCSKKYGLVGEPYKNSGRCNCDSYMVVNKIDNGIFNVSLWSEDLHTFYPTTKSAGIFNARLKYGTKFAIFIHGRLKKTQCFRYTIKISDGVTERILHQETTYVFKTIITRKGEKNVNCVFFNSGMPGLEFLTKHNVVTEKSKLIFLFDIYEYKIKDFGEHTNQCFGSFELNDNDMPVYKKIPGKLPDLAIWDYDGKPQKILPYTDFIKFTKRPMTIEINLVADETPAQTAQAKLHILLKSAMAAHHKDLIVLREHHAGVLDKIQKHKEELTELETGMNACEEIYKNIDSIVNCPANVPLPESPDPEEA